MVTAAAKRANRNHPFGADALNGMAGLYAICLECGQMLLSERRRAQMHVRLDHGDVDASPLFVRLDGPWGNARRRQAARDRQAGRSSASVSPLRSDGGSVSAGSPGPAGVPAVVDPSRPATGATPVGAQGAPEGEAPEPAVAGAG